MVISIRFTPSSFVRTWLLDITNDIAIATFETKRMRFLLIYYNAYLAII